MYIYQADTYCDECGLWCIQELKEAGCSEPILMPDSDDWPQHSPNNQETDYPNHCAQRGNCRDSIDLRNYGLDPRAQLFGAETYLIGSLLSENLTEQGVTYLKNLLEEKTGYANTAYRIALHNYWREVFGAYLQEGEEEKEYSLEATVWVKVWAYNEEDAKRAAKTHSNWEDWDLMEVTKVERA